MANGGQVLRSLLERLSRGVVLKRRLPAECGGLALFVSPDASLKYWRRDLRKTDSALLDAAKSLVKSGDVVWDVGANIGLFSFASAGLAGKGGQVLAIEPDPWLSGLLRRSAELNGGTGCAIHVLPLAVGEQTGHAVLNIARRGEGGNGYFGRTARALDRAVGGQDRRRGCGSGGAARRDEIASRHPAQDHVRGFGGKSGAGNQHTQGCRVCFVRCGKKLARQRTSGAVWVEQNCVAGGHFIASSENAI